MQSFPHIRVVRPSYAYHCCQFMPSTYENLVIIINIIIVITIIVKIVVIININIEGAGVCRLWRFARGYFLPWGV